MGSTTLPALLHISNMHSTTVVLPIKYYTAMHDRDDLIEYNAEEYNTYQKVNRLFAEKLQQIAQPDDLIWVHDYHFSA